MGAAGIGTNLSATKSLFAPRLQDRVAIVTGGGQGLGQAITERLAREGANVIIGDINVKSALRTAEQIAMKTGRKIFVAGKVDVGDEADVARLADAAISEFGRLDIAVSNAGIVESGKTIGFDLEKWNKVLAVNLTGYFLLAQHAARVMIEQKSGSIIQINSKSGKKGSQANAAYATSKFGGIGLTQSLALEFAPFNVRVNAICPGNLLDSPLWNTPGIGLLQKYLDAGKVPGATTVEDVLRYYTEQVPMKRGCTYDDVCNLMIFLASDDSSYMTGQAINVTGGQEMR
ncbi:MAG: sorbitol-6-phosphate dehydrogenase [Candidatus Margulisiibacteriota bacterium]